MCRWLGLFIALIIVGAPARVATGLPSDQTQFEQRPPNVILILADDLGYGELGCYGQAKIKTPNLDALAAQGVRLTQFYSGSPVCAPSRCTLLTGRHTGHAAIRDNKEIGGWGPNEPEGQWPLPAGERTIGEMLQERGYVTAAIGKWGLGGPRSAGHPNLQGFDFFYGYLCQRVAHNFYPTHMWRNTSKEWLEGNEWFSAHQRLDAAPESLRDYDQYQTRHYAPDLMIREALEFVRDNREKPFFLYFATPVPHVALQVPRDSLLEYDQLGWDEQPYLGQKGYLPHPSPRAAYAAMITRMDRDIGRLVSLVDDLGLGDDTIILFTSDNGPTWAGGVDQAFFDPNGGWRGLKASLYEGGIRVPCIVRWPGKIPPGTMTNQPGAFWDLMPTIAAMTGAESTDGIDGVDLSSALVASTHARAAIEPTLYWEFHGTQAVRQGDWKLLWNRRDDAAELYDLAADPAERKNIAAGYPDVVERLKGHIESNHRLSGIFKLPIEKEDARYASSPTDQE